MNKISAYIKNNTRLVCIVLTLFLFLSIILAISIGPVYISFTDVWKIMFNKLFMYGDISNLNINTKNIVWYLRAPRVLLGMMVGACLALSGVSMQTFTKNPLADPYILGISSGASCGAVISMLTSIFFFAGRYSIALGAFVGAIFSIFLVYYLSKTGREVTPIKLMLVGVAVSAMFSAFTNYLVYNAPNDAQVKEATFWILGSLAGAKWEYLVPPAVALVPSVIIMFCLSSPLNAMMMGDNTAITLGINIGFNKKDFNNNYFIVNSIGGCCKWMYRLCRVSNTTYNKRSCGI